jgi:predicted nucleic acid-binding protein
MAKRRKTVLIDTNIVIRYMERNPFIINELENVIGVDNLVISIISIGEIYYGMRKSEEKETK